MPQHDQSVKLASNNGVLEAPSTCTEQLQSMCLYLRGTNYTGGVFRFFLCFFLRGCVILPVGAASSLASSGPATSTPLPEIVLRRFRRTVCSGVCAEANICSCLALILLVAASPPSFISSLRLWATGAMPCHKDISTVSTRPNWSVAVPELLPSATWWPSRHSNRASHPLPPTCAAKQRSCGSLC